MQYEIFTVPILENQEDLEKMNLFLRSHRVVQVDKELVRLGERVYWSFCVCYLDGFPLQSSSVPGHAVSSDKKPKIDYREVLPEEQFKRFVRLREIRKQLAEDDAVPAYAVFTDAELALLAQKDTLTEAEMLKIEGIGKRRIEKYGVEMIRRFNKAE